MLPIDPLYFGYLAYLKQLVRVELYPKDEWVLDFLFICPFYWSVELDDNLAYYGKQYREQYALEFGDAIPIGYLDGMCSVLEMLIALASRGETQIMCDPAVGDRTHVWFWMMINKLRLDDCTCIEEAMDIVSNLLNRTFQPNGEGSVCGPFLYHPQDMRTVTFWYQFRFWAEENYTF